ncbi:hypothetical protein ACKKBG_A22185 [Auxenochlorella protothecoides x Auxenochlorella symbiontica]
MPTLRRITKTMVDTRVGSPRQRLLICSRVTLSPQSGCSGSDWPHSPITGGVIKFAVGPSLQDPSLWQYMLIRNLR